MVPLADDTQPLLNELDRVSASLMPLDMVLLLAHDIAPLLVHDLDWDPDIAMSFLSIIFHSPTGSNGDGQT